MTARSFDLIVIGLGPGGEELAERMAEAGWSVLGVDCHLVGGECPYYGCIPSKMMVRGAELLAEARRVNGMAGIATVAPDLTPAANRIRDEATDDWNDQVAVDRFVKLGGTFVRGVGRLAGRDDDGMLRVGVDGDEYTAPRVCIATGTAPNVPPIDGLAELYVPGSGPEALVWTNRQIVKARTAPRSMVVIGGGAVGVELAQAFARFGTTVTVLETGPRILAPEEPEASAVITEVFEREGISVRTSVSIERVGAGGEGVEVTLADGSTVSGEKVLVAAGRRPNLPDIGLETVGLDPHARVVEVDDRMRAVRDGQPVEGVYAIGDIVGRGAFTHVSVWQARVMIADLLDRTNVFGGYHGLAWATFTDPEIGRVGMSEQQARDKGLAVRIGTAQMSASTRGWIHGPGNDGIIKLVADTDRGVLVGATIVGPYGGELLGLLTLAVHAEVPLHTLATMHYAYPTLHRGILDAVLQLASPVK
jgi:pyruvate/2-oxoglutarate dehydrogenase complex dihydrolipoamide dehydrogenase (E3) component